MTREEEIKRASVMYHLYYYDYSYEEGEHLDFYIKGFTEGAMWADENPKNIWHDVSEMPDNHSYIMFMIDRYTIKTDYVPVCLKHCQLNGSNWNEFVKATNMKRWAYIRDLLPKGGEL